MNAGSRLFARIEMIRALIAYFAAQNVMHPADQGGRQEGLSDEVPAVVENQHRAIGVAGHQHHTHLWPQVLQNFRQLRAGHVRHS